MKLYLVQHGEAKPEEEDPLRSLSEKGIEDVRKMANYASKRLSIKVERIFHSGKLRAKQTAEELAKGVDVGRGIEESKELEPLADPKFWVEKLAKIDKDTMLVGHMPHLNKLSSLLLSGDETKKIIQFKTAGIVCLERDERNNWSVLWIVIPEIIPENQ
ncbi:MAG: phosphohistidine phosphatase SixA [Candidatus Bathyarchaeia archaeon]